MFGIVELLLLVFSAIGIFDSLYISYHATTNQPVKCWFFPKRWCKKVQFSKYSLTFGVPNGYLGFVMYSGILVLTLFFMYTPMTFLPVAFLGTIGFLFALYFTFIQAFVLRAFCIYCIVSAINLTMIFIAILIQFGII